MHLKLQHKEKVGGSGSKLNKIFVDGSLRESFLQSIEEMQRNFNLITHQLGAQVGITAYVRSGPDTPPPPVRINLLFQVPPPPPNVRTYLMDAPNRKQQTTKQAKNQR